MARSFSFPNIGSIGVLLVKALFHSFVSWRAVGFHNVTNVGAFLVKALFRAMQFSVLRASGKCNSSNNNSNNSCHY